MNRRQLVTRFASLSAGLPILLGRIPAYAQNDHGESYFIHIFLRGAADGFLAVDPVVGDKVSSGSFDPTHTSADYAPTAVPGKGNLLVGLGLRPAVSAFASMPTAFIRGLYIEVTAHPLAVNYNFSGRPSLSETRQYPAIGQVIGNNIGGFPAHVILGGAPPLIDTEKHILPTSPLQASNAEGLRSIIDRPGLSYDKSGQQILNISDPSFNSAEQLIDTLENLRLGGLSDKAKQSLAPWMSGKSAIDPLYGKHLGSTVTPSADTIARYGSKKVGDIGDLLAGTFSTLKAGVCRLVTVSHDGFDTHADHFARHVPLLQDMATALAALVADLTAEPAKTGGGTMASKTTILISTDFGRTPKLNLADGTDHWQSGWAIAMGSGVRDNSLVGQTDANGVATGWKNAGPTTFSKDTSLLPDYVISTILRKLGFSDAANTISEVSLGDLVS